MDVAHSTRMIAVAVTDTFRIRTSRAQLRRKARTARRVLEAVFKCFGFSDLLGGSPRRRSSATGRQTRIVIGIASDVVLTTEVQFAPLRY